MKIMIVDDDPLVQESLKIILERDGDIEVVSLCGSGREAVSAFAEVKPDLVLSDIRMEDMDGLAATSEILKIDPQAKVILLTTFLDDEYINQALKVGAKGYILKQDFDGMIKLSRTAGVIFELLQQETDEEAIVVTAEPALTAATMKNSAIEAIAVNDLFWQATGDDGYAQAGLFVKAETAETQPEAVAAYLDLAEQACDLCRIWKLCLTRLCSWRSCPM